MAGDLGCSAVGAWANHMDGRLAPRCLKRLRAGGSANTKPASISYQGRAVLGVRTAKSYPPASGCDIFSTDYVEKASMTPRRTIVEGEDSHYVAQTDSTCSTR